MTWHDIVQFPLHFQRAALIFGVYKLVQLAEHDVIVLVHEGRQPALFKNTHATIAHIFKLAWRCYNNHH